MGETRSGPDAVLDALTRGLRSADGRPVATRVEPTTDGRTRLHFQAEDAYVGSRDVLVHKGHTGVTVLLDDFVLEKYEYREHGYTNAVALHEGFLANLAEDASGVSVDLRTHLTDLGKPEWVAHFGWAPDLVNGNAANLQRCVEWMADLALRQTVWDATDLGRRVLEIDAGDDGEGQGTWTGLIRRTTPAGVYAGLEAINAGLGRTIFQSMSSWWGQHSVPGSALTG